MKSSILKRFRVHYIPMLVASMIFCLTFYVLWKPPLPAIPFVTYTSGYLSIFFLAVSLLLGPANLILKHRNPISTYIRRDIGIVGGTFGVIHSSVGLFMHFTGRPWLYFVEEAGGGFAIRLGNFGLANYTGLFGVLILFLLLTISNDYFLGKLKAVKWKNLQRFTYPMFLLVVAHSIFYRLNADKEDLIIYLYLPMFLVVLVFQLIGIWIKLKKRV
ncbi:sulfoxide reductase heme-binding subunit YedZ [Fodinibius roseus]|uniref:Sulfoxide reductase heme-binding subunit YedZ n=1 Tax=Fodinibius roseus TaxID=1194090 RepID=A0A1M5HK12_9BACT|nr:ferric reductase-like transmembrane domain-containing protein [Fodinibius roseus]SHG16296.1 sulfoxide reductase heme-binding subunit YedZ [Fodinibius roseus]